MFGAITSRGSVHSRRGGEDSAGAADGAWCDRRHTRRATIDRDGTPGASPARCRWTTLTSPPRPGPARFRCAAAGRPRGGADLHPLGLAGQGAAAGIGARAEQRPRVGFVKGNPARRPSAKGRKRTSKYVIDLPGRSRCRPRHSRGMLLRSVASSANGVASGCWRDSVPRQAGAGAGPYAPEIVSRDTSYAT